MRVRPFALLAEYVTESADGKLTVAGIFDRLISSSFPIVHRRMFLVAEFEARVVEGSIHTLTVECVDDDGRAIIPRTSALPLTLVPSLPGLPLRSRVIIELDNTIIPRPGDYEVNLKVDGAQVASVPLHASQAPEPT